MSNIHVTIDRLVLRGLAAEERHAFVASLKDELVRTLANPTARADWARSRRIPVLRLAQAPLEPGMAGARRLGVHVAEGIGRGLKP